MDNKIKALLLGVDLCWRPADNGVGKTYDAIRAKRLTAALDRLTIEYDGLQPDTLSRMLDDREQVIEWLAEHPKASVTLGRWSVTINSPEFDDVDWEQHDCPFNHSCAVEDFSKSRAGDEWCCGWSLG